MLTAAHHPSTIGTHLQPPPFGRPLPRPAPARITFCSVVVVVLRLLVRRRCISVELIGRVRVTDIVLVARGRPVKRGQTQGWAVTRGRPGSDRWRAWRCCCHVAGVAVLLPRGGRGGAGVTWRTLHSPTRRSISANYLGPACSAPMIQPMGARPRRWGAAA